MKVAEIQRTHAVTIRELRIVRRILRTQIQETAEVFEDIATSADVLRCLLESSGKMEPSFAKCIENIKQSCT